MKYILLDSMSHHILPSLVSSTEWDALDTITRDIIKFHDDYGREAADLAILAYQHNTYSKVCYTSVIIVIIFLFLKSNKPGFVLYFISSLHRVNFVQSQIGLHRWF